MKKSLFWLVAGLVLLIGGGALANLHIAALTVLGVGLAVTGTIILIVLSFVHYFLYD